MKFDRTFAHRHDAVSGTAAFTQFDRLTAGLAAQRTEQRAAIADEPTLALPTVVDFGAGRAESAGVARISVRTAGRGDHAASLRLRQ